MLTLVLSVFTVSVFTPDVVCSGFMAWYDMSLGGKNSMLVGCAMSEPA